MDKYLIVYKWYGYEEISNHYHDCEGYLNLVKLENEIRKIEDQDKCIDLVYLNIIKIN